MANEKKQFTRSEAGKLLAYDPHEGRYVQVANVSREMRELSKEFPVTNDEKRAFYHERIKLVRSANLRNEQRRQLLRDIRSSAEEEKIAGKLKKIDGRVIFNYEGVIPDSRKRTDLRVKFYHEDVDDSRSRIDTRATFDDEVELFGSRRRAHRPVMFNYEGVMPDSRRRALRRAGFDEESPPSDMPVPGGVGFGIFYKKSELQFTNSTTLYYHIITARNIGSAKNKWLYLTSTNRAPWCCEAFVSYKGQKGPRFTIYDWSKKAEHRWRVSIPISRLNQYQLTYRAKTGSYSTIYVMNDTRRLSGRIWTNRVFLRNRLTRRFDLMHQNEYILPPKHERSYLWWGPIIETFHPHPNVINEVGFLDVTLLQDGQTRKLTQNVIDFKKERGFDLIYFKDNFSFIVH